MNRTEDRTSKTLVLDRINRTDRIVGKKNSAQYRKASEIILENSVNSVSNGIEDSEIRSLDRINRTDRIVRRKVSAHCRKPSEIILQNSVNSVSKGIGISGILSLGERAAMDNMGIKGMGRYDLAGQVIGLAMKVHRVLGSGFVESVYHKALLYELVRAGFNVVADLPVQVVYEGIVVGDFKPDILVNNELIVELKAVLRLVVEHEVQVVNCLTATGKDVGLLINFGGPSLEFKKKFRLPKPQ